MFERNPEKGKKKPSWYKLTDNNHETPAQPNQPQPNLDLPLPLPFPGGTDGRKGNGKKRKGDNSGWKRKRT